eukprot:gene14536-4386_t
MSHAQFFQSRSRVPLLLLPARLLCGLCGATLTVTAAAGLSG